MIRYKYEIVNHPVNKLNGVKCNIDYYGTLSYRDFQNDLIPVTLNKKNDKANGKRSDKATIKSTNMKFIPLSQ